MVDCVCYRSDNSLAETSESTEDFPSAEILMDVASVFDENNASVESMNHDELIQLQQRDTQNGDSALQIVCIMSTV